MTCLSIVMHPNPSCTVHGVMHTFYDGGSGTPKVWMCDEFVSELACVQLVMVPKGQPQPHTYQIRRDC